MSPRVSPTERIRAEIDELFSSKRDLAEVLEEVGVLATRLVMQAALEAEVTEFLGRERYGRGVRKRGGYRNGYAPATVKTTAGPVTLARPKLRGVSEAFISRLFGKGVTKTNALESLVIAGYVRGLSTRDIEAALADALGEEAALSPSTVSRICKAIKDEFDAWSKRSLVDVELEYLYLDASNFRYHQGARAEPVICAWGITSAGKAVFLGLAAISAESHDAIKDFLDDLVARGLRSPVLIISDGAGGLIGAAEDVFPKALRQRCLIHKARNVLAKVSKGDQDEVKADFWSIFDNIETGEGDAAVAEARRRLNTFSAKWSGAYPGAVACVTEDFDALTTHLRFPKEHWMGTRHTNLIERTFGEAKRRTKVIGRLPGEHSCLSLIWAVLDRASRGWRGVKQTPANVRLLQQLRHDLFEPDQLKEVIEEERDDVTPAA
ncbi:MAG: IS256 family transposase [Acidobacteria bacterium]|nr:MAG: IS256 family transposase [Acidobacteriota bacterium]